MEKKKTGSIHKGRVPMLIVMLLISAVALFPFYSMLMMGTYKTSDLYSSVKLLPGNYLMENLKRVLATPIFTFYRNSLVVAICSSLACVLVSSLAGYALSKFRFKGRNLVSNFILITMMVPSQLGIVAYVLQMRKMGMTDTLLPLILPFAASAFGVFWIRSFTDGAVPYEVIESARIDGAGEFEIFWKIVMPFIRPACITLLLLAFLWSWNDFLYPLVLINKNELYTIPLGIRQMSGAYSNDTAAQILGLSLSTLPILLLFIAFNKNINLSISRVIVGEQCCIKAFIRGAFLSSGYMADPQSAYHLEFVTPYYSLSKSMAQLLTENGFKAKTVVRRSNYVVYIKDSLTIENLLGFMGAKLSAFSLINTKISKEVANNINRVENCSIYNLEKTISKSVEQVKAINKIERTIGLRSLSQDLIKVAKLRLEHTDASLNELSRLCKGNISKSALGRKLAKICEIASNIKE